MDISYFFIFILAPFVLLNFLSLKYQKKFIELYKEKVNSKELFYPNEITHKYAHSPKNFIEDVPKMIEIRLKVFFGDFKDKELNDAARPVRRFYFAIVILLFIQFIILSFTI